MLLGRPGLAGLFGRQCWGLALVRSSCLELKEGFIGSISPLRGETGETGAFLRGVAGDVLIRVTVVMKI